jgi:hypothetical protein
VTVGSLSGGGYNLSFSGSTFSQLSAVQRWAQLDAGVAVKTIDVPSDGRFLLGSKVTNLGGGQYHYEYALFNMNSDRGGQAFSIPLPTGATATNVGFHDVDYHSGEPYALTDWPAAVTPGASISWATQTFAQNQNANALRWSTTYNFRFDSNRPPVQGNVTLSLFKTGSPSSILVTGVDIPSGSCPDSDGDGTDDCIDGCPNDPGKIAPGTCGCGVADTDSDGDGTPNCNDGCPERREQDLARCVRLRSGRRRQRRRRRARLQRRLSQRPEQDHAGRVRLRSRGRRHGRRWRPQLQRQLSELLQPAAGRRRRRRCRNVCDNCPQLSNVSQSDGDLDAVGRCLRQLSDDLQSSAGRTTTATESATPAMDARAIR